jgi:hypothetical protein|tara:strand:+ start:983 stop:1174 length:192 start_codon:yes stop_codon:yes gene_type:complete
MVTLTLSAKDNRIETAIEEGQALMKHLFTYYNGEPPISTNKLQAVVLMPGMMEYQGFNDGLET